MKKISTKLIILLVSAALVPLVLFGIFSIMASRATTYRSISEGNLNVAKRAADQIELYVQNGTQILKGIAENISRTHLQTWQKETIIKNYVINFEQFHEIYLTDRKGVQVATTDLGAELKDKSKDRAVVTAMTGEVYRSEVYISDQLVPMMTISLPVVRLNEVDGAVVGVIDLIDMWNLVDSIRIGHKGFAFIISKEGMLIAHGRDDAKPSVIKSGNRRQWEIVKTVLSGKSGALTYRNERGEEVLGVCAPITSLGWGVVIEQPPHEAYAMARRMTYQLAILIIAFVILMTIIGLWGGRQIVGPIRELIRGTRAISNGDLGQRVQVKTRDEFSELGESFNRMTGDLLKLQEEIRRNERAVTFGKIASGLFHDLKHPIKSIENSSRLLPKMYDDSHYRETFHRTVNREFANINRFLDDLHNLTHPIPLKSIPLNIHKIIDETIEGYRPEAERNGIRILRQFQRDSLRISADRFAIERVLKNLILNAIEAMPQGGDLVVKTKANGQLAEIEIGDTGCGIPKDRLGMIFEDYVTTKRKGLGLGLAISKKIVQDLNGTIEVESEPGKGTTFTLKFPLL
ncbi:MAG: HAMP domain-containing protein [Syntrophobacterales bacterium]|nr:MAG: HAMP domain-containing protein [Syntrophobacterales bacterium]